MTFGSVGNFWWYHRLYPQTTGPTYTDTSYSRSSGAFWFPPCSHGLEVLLLLSLHIFTVHKERSLVVEKNLPYSFPARVGGCLSLTAAWRAPSQLTSLIRKVTPRQDQVFGASPQPPLLLQYKFVFVVHKYKSRVKALWQDSHKTHLDPAEETQIMHSKRLKPVNDTRLWEIN